jgi:uncharacterized membrane protein
VRVAARAVAVVPSLPPSPRIRSAVQPAPWLVAIGASAAFFAMALIRHLSFHSSAYDLGFYDQVLWNAADGRGLSSTFIHYGFFGEHFEPALLAFVPLYRLAPSVVWLMAAQSAALGLATVPLHDVARRLVGPPVAWVAVTAYLLQTSVARAVVEDFHTEALAVPFVFLALRFALERRWLLFVLCSAAPLLTKEDGALVVNALGVMAFLLTRRFVALLPAAGALLIGAVVLFWVMPAFRAGAPGDLILRYAYLGTTAGQVALHVMTQPSVWVAHLIGSPAPLAILTMLAAAGFLPLLRPAALATALVPLIPAVLSTDPYQEALHLQYGVPAVPLFVIAALLGWQRLPPNAGALALVGGASITWLWFGPIIPRLQTDLPALQRAGMVESVLARIPAGAGVSASTGLVPHLSERAEIWEFPAGPGIGWVVIDSASPPSQPSLAFGYRDAAQRLHSSGYEVVAQSAGVTLWQRVP